MTERTTTAPAEAVVSPHPSGPTRLIATELPVASVAHLLSGISPEQLLDRATAAWERGREGRRLLAFGDAARVGGDRESGLASAIAALAGQTARVRTDTSYAARPRFFGGARFRPGGRVRFEGWAPFGGWQFVLPRLLIVFEGHEAKATVIASEAELAGAGLESLAVDALAGGTREVFDIAAGETTGTDFEHWAGSIDAAIDAIRAGAYQKVVLAVQRSVEMASNIDQGALLASLASRYPDCYTFKFVAGGAAWLGASPELLVGNERGAVSAASLAGSRPRGRTAEDDDALAEELMTSPKERVEHRLVVEALVGSLATVCDGVEASTEPQVMRMANIQHLHTPVCGTVRPGSDILDLVAAVHPTPAVGGSPRRAAVAAIEALEDIDRGWYAAPIGWLDLEGNGEFAVALRSGLVRGNRADLFAGCGIVDGSVPQAEIAEVEQKLRALGDTIEALQA